MATIALAGGLNNNFDRAGSSNVEAKFSNEVSVQVCSVMTLTLTALQDNEFRLK